MSIICIANQKGGVGKTTTVAALARGLSEHNKRVLLIDWDPQASLTVTMGFNPDTLKWTGYYALVNAINNKIYGEPEATERLRGISLRSGVDS
jgi:chromosome partitioning protein